MATTLTNVVTLRVKVLPNYRKHTARAIVAAWVADYCTKQGGQQGLKSNQVSVPAMAEAWSADCPTAPKAGKNADNKMHVDPLAGWLRFLAKDNVVSLGQAKLTA